MAAGAGRLRVGVVGLGKMGISHLSMLRAHPAVAEAVVCDSAKYVLDLLSRSSGLATWTDYDRMLDEAALDAVVIATPTPLHASMVRKALERGLHVFCEKPFVLRPADGAHLVTLANTRGLVNQVGYHNRFVSTFVEAKRLIDHGAIGTVSHALLESYGPVVLRPSSTTWRSKRTEGGGCVYDYAAHPIDLANWFLGSPVAVRGTILGRVFSREVEDEVYSTLQYEGGRSAQLSVNWSDESYRRMTTKATIWGSQGRIYVDRQELNAYLRDAAAAPTGYGAGWNARYTTDLTPPVWFYIRGEEYSAQLDYFLRRVTGEHLPATNSFASARVTDELIANLYRDAAEPVSRLPGDEPVVASNGNGSPDSRILPGSRALQAVSAARERLRERRTRRRGVRA